MKITDIRTLCLSRAHEPERVWASATFQVPKADCPIVVIDTDEGLQGIGEPSAYGVPPTIRASIDALKPQLIGRDPTDPELLPWPGAENRAAAIPTAGVDCALWDLRGKAAGKQVCQLLAPDRQPLDRVRLYASAGVSYDWDDNPESVVEEAVAIADRGLTAYKMRLGTHWAWSGVTVDRFLQLAGKVHQAVGHRMEQMLDGNCRLSEEEALTIATALDEMGWTWFEEPIPSDQIDGYARLNAAVEMPVTGGESMWALEQIEPYLEKKAYAIVQAEAGVCGITETWRIAQHCHQFGVPLCPHSWHNGLMAMANGHIVAAHPAPRVLELNMSQGPLQWEILRDPPQIEDGHLVLPAAPGLGVDLADDLEQRFPYIEGSWGNPVAR